MNTEQIKVALGEDLEMALRVLKYVSNHGNDVLCVGPASRDLKIPILEVERIMLRLVEFGLIQRMPA